MFGRQGVFDWQGILRGGRHDCRYRLKIQAKKAHQVRLFCGGQFSIQAELSFSAQWFVT